jgi:hypothetical protein
MTIFDGSGADLGWVYAPLTPITPPPPPPPTGRPYRMLVGPVSRGIAPTKTGEFAGMTSGFIIDDYQWSDLQLTDPTKLTTATVTAIIGELDWASTHTGIDGQPYTCILRFGAGYQSPPWLKDLAGTYVGYGKDGTQASWPQAPSDPAFHALPGGVPCYWRQSFIDAYTNLIRLIAASPIGTHAALAGVTMALPCTQFNEPTIKQYACKENRDNAVGAGWTQTLDDAAFMAAFNAHSTHLTPLGVFTECSYNPAESVKTVGGVLRYDSSATRAVALMNSQLATLGGMCIWANHGWQADQMDPVYARMRDGAAAANPTGFGLQTRTLGKHKNDYTAGNTRSTVPLSCSTARDLGASWVELPGGSADPSETVQKVTSAFLSTLMAGFRANAAKLIGSPSDPPPPPPPPPPPTEPLLSFQPIGGGGGTTTGVSIHPLNTLQIANSTDTCGPEISVDGGVKWARVLTGLTPGGNQRGSGIQGDPLVAGRWWYAGGSSGEGALWAVDWNPATSVGWKKVSSGSSTAIIHDGGQPYEPERGGSSAPTAPRCSGTPHIVDAGDSTTVFVYDPTVNNGLWRMRVARASGMALSEQIQFSGTAGLYIEQAIPLKNVEAATGANQSRMIIAPYDVGTPKRLMLSTNAQGASPSAATITGAPMNCESLCFRLGSAGSALPVVIATQQGEVYWSTDAHSAATPTFTAFASGPDAGSTFWVSCALGEDGSNYVLLVGALDGVATGGGKVKGLYRATWAQSASPSTATWTTISNTTNVSRKMLNDSTRGDFALADYTAPGNASNFITGLSVLGSKWALAGRVCSYLSTDKGINWYPVPIASGYGGYGAAVDPRSSTAARVALTSADYPFWTVATPTSEPRLTLDRKDGNAETGPVAFDPRNGDSVICASSGGGSPELDDLFPATRIYTAPWAVASSVGSSLADWTEAGAWPQVPGDSAGNRPRSMGQAVVYGTTAASRTIVAGRVLGNGLMYWNATSQPTWTTVTSTAGPAPFSVSTGHELQRSVWHEPTNKLFILDKGTRIVWRMNVAANGTISAATAVCKVPSIPVMSNRFDVYGWLELDPNSPATAPRLVVTGDTGIWVIDNAHTATCDPTLASDMSTAQKLPWTNGGQALAGLRPGAVRFATPPGSTTSYLWVWTVDFDSVTPWKVIRVKNPFGTETITDVTTPGIRGSLGYLMTCDVARDSTGDTGFVLATYGAGRNGGYWWVPFV